jgi:RNase P/RNase MRP subunit p29
MSRTIRMTVAGALVVAACATALAQQAQTIRVQGTIAKVDGDVLTLKASDGTENKLTLTGNAVIVAVVKASMAEVKEGVFLGSAAMPQPDGSQKALDVHIFPEQMRGTGEGHRPYAPVPNSTMTNGTASGATVVSTDGSTMLVKYKDGEKKIVVPPNTPIVRYEIGSKADLKPGAAFRVLAATKKPDGTLETARINVGRDGTVPQ